MKNTVLIQDEKLIIKLSFWSRVWSMKSHLEFPLEQVVGATHDSGIEREQKGFRAPGTHFPRLITAGTYYLKGEKSFWNIRNGDNAVVIRLRGAKYQQVVIETGDPAATERLINGALRTH